MSNSREQDAISSCNLLMIWHYFRVANGGLFAILLALGLAFGDVEAQKTLQLAGWGKAISLTVGWSGKKPLGELDTSDYGQARRWTAIGRFGVGLGRPYSGGKDFGLSAVAYGGMMYSTGWSFLRQIGPALHIGGHYTFHGTLAPSAVGFALRATIKIDDIALLIGKARDIEDEDSILIFGVEVSEALLADLNR